MGRFGAFELIIILVVGLVFYFVPTIIASSRNHTNRGGIFVLNLLLGWTFLGWIAAFIWSLTATGRQAVIVTNNNSNHHSAVNYAQTKNNESEKTGNFIDRMEQLQRLKQLFDSGVLSEDEFNREKSKILG